MKKESIISQSMVFGVFGNPISHSLSPLMHNTALQHLGIDGVYHAFQVLPDDLEVAIQSIRALNFRGVNVTVPYKQKVGSFLDELQGDAALTGSVNTILNSNGKLIGYSTDGLGFIRSVKEEADFVPRNSSAIILGAGGAATAIAFRLAQEGLKKMMIISRSLNQGQALCRELDRKMGFTAEHGSFDKSVLEDIAGKYSLIVNTTPIGMSSGHPEEMPLFLPEWTKSGTVFCDLIYNPLETAWLRKARLMGRKTVSGLGMLVYQGAESFQLWTGCEMPTDYIFGKLSEYYNKNGFGC